MAFPPLQLTFGVELEHKLVIHESLLQPYVSALNDESYILKNHGSSQGPETIELLVPRRLGISSWAIAKDWNPTGNTQQERDDLVSTYIRSYEKEALDIEFQILRSVVPGVQKYPDSRPSDADYSHWHITTDTSLQGSNHLDKFRRVPWLRDEARKDEWDQIGLELPSRVFTLSSPTWKTEIPAVLSVLVGGPEKGLHSAYVDDECGTHIHIGNNGDPFPLPVLQNLAYLLVIYEAEISKIHSWARRITSENLASNISIFEAHPGSDMAGISPREAASIEDAKATIFATRTRNNLINIMGGSVKASFVSFQGQWDYGTSYRPRVPTLEFRQHDGVLSWPALDMWILFVTELMKLADRYARGLGSCQVLHRDDVSIDTLFDEMNFPRHAREYFYRRMAWFAAHATVKGTKGSDGEIDSSCGDEAEEIKPGVGTEIDNKEEDPRPKRKYTNKDFNKDKEPQRKRQKI